MKKINDRKIERVHKRLSFCLMKRFLLKKSKLSKKIRLKVVEIGSSRMKTTVFVYFG